MYLSLYCKGSKRITQGFNLRGSWRPNISAIFWPPLFWPSALSFSYSLGLLNRRPRGSAFSLSAGFLYHILSATSLDPNSSRAPRAPSAWCGFPYPISSLTPTVWLLSWLSHIIVQRPLNRLLNLWNGTFDRHQAEITVMQFTGHSSPCSILSADLTCAISSHNCHWNVSLPPGASLWMAFWPGRRSKYNSISPLSAQLNIF